MAMCLYHFCGIMCNWGLGILGARRCFSDGYPCIGRNGILKFEKFGRLIFDCFSRSGWRVFGVFGHLIAIFLHMGIYVGLSLLIGSYVLLLRTCVGFGLHHLVWRLGSLLANMV